MNDEIFVIFFIFGIIRIPDGYGARLALFVFGIVFFVLITASETQGLFMTNVNPCAPIFQIMLIREF